MSTVQDKKLTPQTANTMKKVCSLKRDNYTVNGSWIIVDDKTVCIHNQFTGKPSTGSVTMSKKVFERLIKFYQTGK